MKNRNVTISLEEEVVRWARVRAAEQDVSLSSMIGTMLRDKMLEQRRYTQAMQEFFSFEPKPLGKAGEKLPTREEIYDREVLR